MKRSRSTRYEEGMATRRSVLGDAHVDRAEAAKSDLDARFQELITEAAWGHVWSGAGLTKRQGHSRKCQCSISQASVEESFIVRGGADANCGRTRGAMRDPALTTPLTFFWFIPTHGDGIIAVLWLGLLGSFIAYLCYFFLIEHLGATLASMVTYLFPVVGVALGTILLHEAFDIRMAIGTALVLVGIGVVTLRYDPRVSRVPREAGE